MTIDAPLDARTAAVPPAPVNGLLTSPILPTLLKLALPNTIAMFGTTLVAVAETSYIGRLGTEPLAGIALVFPFVMLTQMMSAGAMGGGVSSAVSRALGAGNRERAAEQALLYSEVLFSGDLAGQHARLRRARHRRHADTLGGPDRRRDRADRGRRRARARAFWFSEIRHARRRRGATRSLHARGYVPDLVSRQRPQPADAELCRVPFP